MSAATNWTAEMDEALLKARVREVGVVLQVSRETVRDRILKLGLREGVNNFWSEDQLAVLREEWPRGTTGTQIGILIGKSRNAVIGKANRLKLGARAPRNGAGRPKQEGPPRIRKRVPKQDMATRKIPPRFYPAAIPLTTKDPISIMELRYDTCRAPVGSGLDGLVTYCGDFTFPGKPFCAGHCALYYKPPEARARR